MTNLAVPGSTDLAIARQVFGNEQLDLIKEQIGRGWNQPMTDTELAVVATICQRTRLDPLAKPPQIYFIKRYDSKLKREVMTPQVSVDGLRLNASRTRDYIGPGGQFWCGKDGIWRDIWTSDEPPFAARVGVLKRGHREPLFATALWSEWAQWQDEYRNGTKTGNKVLATFWRDKPAHMLAKTAECIALKQAFPGETNEMEIAHLEEIQRLEVSARVAMYDRIHGTTEAEAFAELPMGAGAPAYALSAPQEAPVVEEVIEEEPATPVQERTEQGYGEPQRGALLEMYGSLLTQARHAGVVADAAPWVLRSDTPTVAIIAKGRELRALITAANAAPAAQPAMQQTAAIPPKLVGARSALANRMSAAEDEADELGVGYEDLAVSYPIDQDLLMKRIETLEGRNSERKSRLADGVPDDQPELEELPL